MITTKNFNLNGLQLSGDTPVTPRTRTFLTSKGAQIEQSGGFITITGCFSISAIEIREFLENKKAEDLNKTTKQASAPTCKM